MMIGLWVVSDHFVLTLFGTKWETMIPILKIFSIIGLIQSVVTLNGNLYLSQGRSDLQFKVGLIVGILGIIAIIFGLRWGIQGVAVAYGIYSVLVVYPTIHIAVSLIELSFIEVIKNLSGITACSVVMGIVVYLFGLILPNHWPQWGFLIVQVSVGIVFYGLLIHFFNLEAYQEIKELLIQHWQGIIHTYK